ncbi:MAG: methyltransferase domain-containing protein [Candidatus Bathyarchaeia archaeon]
MSSGYGEWDEVYRLYPSTAWGWELGKPRPVLVEFVEKGRVRKGRALDLCCGAGTNTVYLTSQGFEVVGVDISPTAIAIARKKAERTDVKIDFSVQSFVDLSFQDTVFDFVFDMGCFHHVEPADRDKFISGVHRVLKADGSYMLTCFSSRNGSAWNHFTRKQLVDLFSGRFVLTEWRHYPSLEGDGYTRYFYTVLMEKK